MKEKDYARAKQTELSKDDANLKEESTCSEDSSSNGEGETNEGEAGSVRSRRARSSFSRAGGSSGSVGSTSSSSYGVLGSSGLSGGGSRDGNWKERGEDQRMCLKGRTHARVEEGFAHQ